VGVCKAYAKPACASDPKYAHCTYVNFESYFLGLGEFFCSGAPAVDAGQDASDDASDAADD
jgi:hypothetical protein